MKIFELWKYGLHGELDILMLLLVLLALVIYGYHKLRPDPPLRGAHPVVAGPVGQHQRRAVRRLVPVHGDQHQRPGLDRQGGHTNHQDGCVFPDIARIIKMRKKEKKRVKRYRRMNETSTADSGHSSVLMN